MRRASFAFLSLGLVILAACGGPPETAQVPGAGMDAVDRLETLHARTTNLLGEVMGARTAEQVLPDLQEIDRQYAELSERVPDLSDAARARIAAVAGQILPGLRSNVQRIGAMPAAGQILEETLADIVDKVRRLQHVEP